MKQTDEALLKNPYAAGKSVLNPKCKARTKKEKSFLVISKYNPCLTLFVMPHYFL